MLGETLNVKTTLRKDSFARRDSMSSNTSNSNNIYEMKEPRSATKIKRESSPSLGRSTTVELRELNSSMGTRAKNDTLLSTKKHSNTSINKYATSMDRRGFSKTMARKDQTISVSSADSKISGQDMIKARRRRRTTKKVPVGPKPVPLVPTEK